MGGCQDYGPFLDPYYNTAPNIWGTHKGTIILTTTHIGYRDYQKGGCFEQAQAGTLGICCNPHFPLNELKTLTHQVLDPYITLYDFKKTLT